ncbi:4-hydroxybenzoate polyprenyltransferase-like prenyltransferase [Candidatus Nitrososphaera evergladensis SR1]|uniref:4-hydroxybenzoate polyprenyltransferase-like prenyltransferase n=1 Tax=Candidatus Nitrososphaera evergladensis SR1 TaxID=1459636 RepID=A0A075MS01_9ARCH|nr:4-hydroxybenzoate polyprenyltransferase-like prenyltransferase [Candidatus Nitrososphaera evergladensis SR1]
MHSSSYPELGRKQQRQEENRNASANNVSFLRSQLILFQSRQKWGLVYSLATVVGLFCLPGALGVFGQQQQTLPILDVVQKSAPLPFISLLITIGMYVLNDLADSDLDKANGKKRPIPSGLVSKRQALEFVMMTNGIAVILSLVTLNVVTMVMVVPMLVIGILYSSRKAAFENKFVVKNVSIAVFYMLCALLGMTSGYTLGLAVDNPFVAIRAAAALGIMVFISSILNDLGDIEGDRQAGRRTIPIVMGEQGTIKMAIALAAGLFAISWLTYWLSGGSGLVTAVLTTLFSALIGARIANLRKGVNDVDFLRRQHKNFVPLHFLLQLFLFGGGALF